MADIIFPKGSNWIYYFNRSQIYKGATKVSLAFKLDETPFYIKSNSVFPFKGELWIVYLEEGVYEKTIITGDYTDIFNIEYVNLVLKIQVKRYYKDD
jgi:alpha-glucosidase (family GH31 glycosyl hydrolase)